MKGTTLGARVLMVAFIGLTISSTAFAQYKLTPLVSNQAGAATLQDPNLINGWGLTRGPATPFWVSDNVIGKETLYSVNPATGVPSKVGLIVTIPPASGAGTGTPTGNVFNITGGNVTPSFVVSQGGKSAPAAFIFATLDGTISGWNPNVNATTAVIEANQSGSGATYTGLAIASTDAGDFLYAADNGPNSHIDMYDGKFKLVKSFTDPEAHGGFAPYGIQNLDGNIWVTFGGNKSSAGFVDEFDTQGNLLKHFAVSGPLHSPWGLALAPLGFGPFSGALLVGDNIPKGRIDAFDPSTGAFLGILRDTSGQPIEINQVWAIMFGNGGNGGAVNHLFFCAGPNNYANGLFGVIEFVP